GRGGGGRSRGGRLGGGGGRGRVRRGHGTGDPNGDPGRARGRLGSRRGGRCGGGVALRQTEDLGDVEDVARPVAANADLGVAGLEDLVAVNLGVHEGGVDVVHRRTGADVVAEHLPVLHL